MLEQAIKDLLESVTTVLLLSLIGLAAGTALAVLLRGVGEAGRGLGDGLSALLDGLGALLRGLGAGLGQAAGGVGAGVGEVIGAVGDLLAGPSPSGDTHTFVDTVPRTPRRPRRRVGRAVSAAAQVGAAAVLGAGLWTGRAARRASRRVAREAVRAARRLKADAGAAWRASRSRTWYDEEPPLWEWGVPEKMAGEFCRTLDEAGVPYTAYTAGDGTVRVVVEDPDLAREAVAEAGWVEVEPPAPVPATIVPVEVFDPETGEWLVYDENGLHTPDPSAGGRALVQKYGRGYMREIGRRGGLARWRKS